MTRRGGSGNLVAGCGQDRMMRRAGAEDLGAGMASDGAGGFNSEVWPLLGRIGILCPIRNLCAPKI